MTDSNPTGGGDAVVLTISSKDLRFLRFIFEVAQGGIREELAEHPHQPKDASRLDRELAAYAKLLEALERNRSLVPDRDVIDVLRDLAEANDRENEYASAVEQHEALYGLLGQIDGSKGSA
jgi:hypothetical protein